MTGLLQSAEIGLLGLIKFPGAVIIVGLKQSPGCSAERGGGRCRNHDLGARAFGRELHFVQPLNFTLQVDAGDHVGKIEAHRLVLLFIRRETIREGRGQYEPLTRGLVDHGLAALTANKTALDRLDQRSSSEQQKIVLVHVIERRRALRIIAERF